jgi:phage shock protein C
MGYAPAPPLSGATRSLTNRKIAGVCGGLSEHYGWDTMVVRLLAVVGGVFLFPLPEIIYCVLWVLMPEQSPLLPSDVQATAIPK